MNNYAKVVRRLRLAGHVDLATRVLGQAFPLHLGAKADDAVGDAYRALVTVKQAIDRMDEPPKEIAQLYREVMRALDATGKARQGTTQVREMLKRLAR